MDTPQRKTYVWVSVASTMAVVVGFWGASLRGRLQQTSLEDTNAAINKAYNKFRETSGNFEQRVGELVQERAATTTPATSPVISDLKARVLEQAAP